MNALIISSPILCPTFPAFRERPAPRNRTPEARRTDLKSISLSYFNKQYIITGISALRHWHLWQWENIESEGGDNLIWLMIGRLAESRKKLFTSTGQICRGSKRMRYVVKGKGIFIKMWDTLIAFFSHRCSSATATYQDCVSHFISQRDATLEVFKSAPRAPTALLPNSLRPPLPLSFSSRFVFLCFIVSAPSSLQAIPVLSLFFFPSFSIQRLHSFRGSPLLPFALTHLFQSGLESQNRSVCSYFIERR